MNRLRSIVACILLLTGNALQAGEVSVAVAANFIGPMNAIAAAFTAETGHAVRLSSGSTGKFYAQIRNGAPFDVLLAADEETPARLVKDGLGVEESRFTYAVGALVLWSPREGLVDAEARVLREGGFNKLALANPRVAPYGRAAVEVMANMGLLNDLEPHFVLGENIAQAYQFTATGNADLGFVALSQVMKDGRVAGGSYWVVPPDAHAPIRQDALLLTSGKDNSAARALLDYLRSDKVLAIIRAYGYASD
ncbi:MAG: molybdate ABC transporter substrate-binding protein [Thiohalomonadaceae bacterium]